MITALLNTTFFPFNILDCLFCVLNSLFNFLWQTLIPLAQTVFLLILFSPYHKLYISSVFSFCFQWRILVFTQISNVSFRKWLYMIFWLTYMIKIYNKTVHVNNVSDSILSYLIFMKNMLICLTSITFPEDCVKFPLDSKIWYSTLL